MGVQEDHGLLESGAEVAGGSLRRVPVNELVQSSHNQISCQGEGKADKYVILYDVVDEANTGRVLNAGVVGQQSLQQSHGNLTSITSLPAHAAASPSASGKVHSDVEADKDRGSPSPFLPQTMVPHKAKSQQSVHEFYHHLFSNDLKTTRERAYFELQVLLDWRYSHEQELNLLVLENETLKSYNRRYLKLIKEVKDGQEQDDGLSKMHDVDNLASVGESHSPSPPA